MFNTNLEKFQIQSQKEKSEKLKAENPEKLPIIMTKAKDSTKSLSKEW